MRDIEETRGFVIGFIILVLIVIGAFILGGSSSDQVADPACSTAGNC